MMRSDALFTTRGGAPYGDQLAGNIARALGNHCEDIACVLLGPPTMITRYELRWGRRGSLALRRDGHRRGLWFDHEEGRGGDVLKLIAREHGVSLREAMAIAETEYLNRFSTEAVFSPPASGRSRASSWLPYWREATDPRGTIVESYLTSRGLALPNGVTNESVRFHPAIGMISLFRNIITDQPCGLHLTRLDCHGGKLAVRMLGRISGAAIKLSPDSDIHYGLHVGEGVESTLTGLLAGFRPAWALGSVGAIRKFPVLSGIDALTVFAETDDNGANAAALCECADRWQGAGREVYALDPLVGGDLNGAWCA